MRIAPQFLKLVTIGSLILLATWGGAIFAAPVTIPLLTYSVVRKKLDGWWNIASKLTLALTLAQVTWAIIYFTLGEPIPAIWLVPTIVFFVACFGFLTNTNRVVRGFRWRGRFG